MEIQRTPATKTVNDRQLPEIDNRVRQVANGIYCTLCKHALLWHPEGTHFVHDFELLIDSVPQETMTSGSIFLVGACAQCPCKLQLH